MLDFPKDFHATARRKYFIFLPLWKLFESKYPGKFHPAPLAGNMYVGSRTGSLACTVKLRPGSGWARASPDNGGGVMTKMDPILVLWSLRHPILVLWPQMHDPLPNKNHAVTRITLK